MENAWKELQPKNIYQGRKAAPLREDSKNALLYLYQPLIGGEALSIYFTLLSEISQESGEGPEGMHADLLSSLGCGIPQFYDARKKLEGIGLLDVYFKEDSDLGPRFIYELLEPLVPKAFFKDSVLAFLLLEKVGERRFQKLTQLFEPKRYTTEGYQKITKKFLDVYRFNEAVYAANQENIESLNKSFEESEPAALLETDSTFDWQFLNDWLTKKHMTVLDDSIIKQVDMYHQLYGFDELTLGELISQSYDFSEQKVSMKELQKAVLAMQRRPVKQIKETVAVAENSNESPTNEHLTNAALQLIKEAQSIPPMKYLEAIKSEKGGYVSKQETWLLQDLVSQSGLSSSVINVLLNYVLVIKNNASLNASYVNTVANEWAQKKIATAEEAIQHIRQISNQAKQSKQKKQTNYPNGKRNVRREKLPDWVNQPKDEKQISSEKKAEIDRRFKEYLAKKEGDI
ncbi:TPA: replication initiation and membrane attachment family protein [Enterococcus faecium]